MSALAARFLGLLLVLCVASAVIQNVADDLRAQIKSAGTTIGCSDAPDRC